MFAEERGESGGELGFATEKGGFLMIFGSRYLIPRVFTFATSLWAKFLLETYESRIPIQSKPINTYLCAS